MSLQQALQAAMRARNLKVGDLLTRMQQRDRSTIYRLLSGDTRDAKMSTLLAVCVALGITPNDLLGLAGLWQESGRSPDPLDMRLRRSFSSVQTLATPYKIVAVVQIERLVETWQDAAGGLLGRESPSRD
ncbi:MAG: helix-turn-helix domain-containing protein [Dehalococcoidia bacterium]